MVGRLNKKRLVGLGYFLRCRIRLRIRRFLRPTLRRPFPRRRLAMRSPLGLSGVHHARGAKRSNPIGPGPKGRFYTEDARRLKVLIVKIVKHGAAGSSFEPANRPSFRPRGPVDCREMRESEHQGVRTFARVALSFNSAIKLFGERQSRQAELETAGFGECDPHVL